MQYNKSKKSYVVSQRYISKYRLLNQLLEKILIHYKQQIAICFRLWKYITKYEKQEILSYNLPKSLITNNNKLISQPFDIILSRARYLRLGYNKLIIIYQTKCKISMKMSFMKWKSFIQSLKEIPKILRKYFSRWDLYHHRNKLLKMNLFLAPRIFLPILRNAYYIIMKKTWNQWIHFVFYDKLLRKQRFLFRLWKSYILNIKDKSKQISITSCNNQTQRYFQHWIVKFNYCKAIHDLCHQNDKIQLRRGWDNWINNLHLVKLHDDDS